MVGRLPVTPLPRWRGEDHSSPPPLPPTWDLGKKRQRKDGSKGSPPFCLPWLEVPRELARLLTRNLQGNEHKGWSQVDPDTHTALLGPPLTCFGYLPPPPRTCGLQAPRLTITAITGLIAMPTEERQLPCSKGLLRMAIPHFPHACPLDFITQATLGQPLPASDFILSTLWRVTFVRYLQGLGHGSVLS